MTNSTCPELYIPMKVAATEADIRNIYHKLADIERQMREDHEETHGQLEKLVREHERGVGAQRVLLGVLSLGASIIGAVIALLAHYYLYEK